MTTERVSGNRVKNAVKGLIHHLPVLLLGIATTACAHASSGTPTSPPKESAPMSATDTPKPHTPAKYPELTPEEIGKRFLKLIEGLKSRDDLSLESAEEATGLSLLQASGKKYYGYGQKLTEGWFYSFWFYPEENGSRRGVRLDFDHPGDRFSNMTAVCALDFDHYHNALKAMGFVDNPTYGEIGQLEYWRYAKFKESDGTVDFEVSIIPQNIVTGESGRLCVKSIHAELY